MTFEDAALIGRVSPHISRVAVRNVKFGMPTELKTLCASVGQDLRPGVPPLFAEEWCLQTCARIYNGALHALLEIFIDLTF